MCTLKQLKDCILSCTGMLYLKSLTLVIQKEEVVPVSQTQTMMKQCITAWKRGDQQGRG